MMIEAHLDRQARQARQAHQVQQARLALWVQRAPMDRLAHVVILAL